jgi:hypothetical protein
VSWCKDKGQEGDRSVYCGEARVEVPLRGKKILGVRLCPHWPAQLKLTDVSLHGQVCAPKRSITLVQRSGLWRRRKRNMEEKKGVETELTFCREGLILDQVQIGFSNETC